MRKIILFTLIVLIGFLSAKAQPSGYKLLTDEAQFRIELSHQAANTQSIKSSFIQEKNLNVLSEKIISKGQFHFKKTNKVRMEYTQPFKYLLIINGDKITIRDDQKTNSFSSKSNKLFALINNIVLGCVQGNALDNKEFSKKIYKNESQYLLVMTPVKKELKEFFNSISIYLDQKDLSVNKLDMEEPGGDSTVITFTNKEINKAVPDALFIPD